MACSFRSSANFWRTSAGISAGSSCTGRASSASRSGLFFFLPFVFLLFPVSGGHSRINAKAPLLHRRLRAAHAPSARAELRPFVRQPDSRHPAVQRTKRRTQHLSRSFRPHHSIVFDYDPGPLSCVHLHKFKILSFLALQAYYISLKMPGQPCKRSISGILPYKNTQRPPRCLRLHWKGRCVRILLWCEEESCTRNRLRPRILMAVV